MKVLLVNGSSREHSCTGTALKEVARTLNENEIETETLFIGNKRSPIVLPVVNAEKSGNAFLTTL